jgi:energy-coupling factor transport system ATP-binding protein
LDRIAKVASEVLVLVDGVTSWRGDPRRLNDEASDVASTGVRVPDRPDLLGIDRVVREPGEVVLSIADLVAGYRDEEVLTGLDLEVRAGETVALVGPNGGGKTTLLRCVLGLADVWEGSVRVSGMDVTRERTSTIARHAGLVFQTPDHQLFARTVRDELGFGPQNLGLDGQAVEARIDALAKAYGLTHLGDVHPFRLSLGQKRRLNVASVLVTSPRLLMLDEPFIGQDLRSIQALNANLQEARTAGTAVVVVSHDLEVLARMADRAIFIEDGAARELPDVAMLGDGGFPWGGGR